MKICSLKVLHVHKLWDMVNLCIIISYCSVCVREKPFTILPQVVVSFHLLSDLVWWIFSIFEYDLVKFFILNLDSFQMQNYMYKDETSLYALLHVYSHLQYLITSRRPGFFVLHRPKHGTTTSKIRFTWFMYFTDNAYKYKNHMHFTFKLLMHHMLFYVWTVLGEISPNP